MTDLTLGASGYLSALQALLATVDPMEVATVTGVLVEAADAGRDVYVFGNGGSAMTASHAITDWNKMTYIHTGRVFRGQCLNDNIGLVTAFGNDIEYAEVFAGQLRSLVRRGDVVLAISGSGNSPNIVRAVEVANEAGAVTLGLCGFDGGRLRALAQHSVWVRSHDMQLCEDVHLTICHIVMKALCRLPVS
jgi:D-sedoheptulose 7-phosphate isomerase